MQVDNPLLERGFPAPFDRIESGHVAPAIDAVLASASERIDALAEGGGGSYADVVGELDDLVEEVERTWAPVSHLHNVNATPELREAYAAALPKVTRFSSRLHQHQALYRRLNDFANSEGGASLTSLQRRRLRYALRDFRRAGVELPPEERNLVERMRLELSELGRRFEENILEETAAYGKVIADKEALAGLPDSALERAAELARRRGVEGWLVTLDAPSVEAVLKHADDRALRREVHTAYLDRCTDGERDNRPLIARILELRRRIAARLGYGDFSDYRLEPLMARSGARVRGFVDDLVAATRPYWRRDVAELEASAAREGMAALRPWDVTWLMERMRRERFAVDDEALRPWFPLEEVQEGLFEIARQLFGMVVRRAENPAVWNPDVRFYTVRDEGGAHLGSFYADWFPRDEKRQGAWMDVLVAGRPAASPPRPHLAFIGGNFTPPTRTRRALLTHSELRTLFHEFGHLLNQIASRVEIPALGGVNVPWDWVEVPSQLMENWCWERDALDRVARHYETGEGLPDALLERMLRSRRFMGGWRQLRQLALANLDLELHRHYAGDEPVMEYAASALRPFAPSGSFVERHLLPCFAHIFAGGYASAYYSYIWSELLEADAFSRFRDEGALNPEVGRAFRDEVLSRGDSRDPEEQLRAFLGRDPDESALIARNLGARDAAGEPANG